ncbi:MAG: hypothetical protein PVF49_13730 [Anaerolineales bacterium]
MGDIDICGRYLHYNAYNGSSGTFYGGESGLSMQESPLSHAVLYGQLEVDENGYVIAAGHSFENQNPDAIVNVEVIWDIGGASFVGVELDSALSPVSDSTSQDWPRVAYQNVNGTWVTHVAEAETEWVIEGVDTTGYWVLVYWRKEGSGPTTGTFTPELSITPIMGGSYSLAASPSGNNEVAISYVTEITDTADFGSKVNVVISHNGGVDWDAPIDLVPWDVNEDSWVAWIESNCMYDTDGYLHVVWNANEYSAADHSASGRDPSRIFHWTNRVAGPVAGGTSSTVQVIYFGTLFGDLCGVGGYNTFNVAKPVISQCGDKLYTIWNQFGNPAKGDSTDCANDQVVESWNGYNGEIYMSVSSNLEGSLWDAGRNLTNSHTPGCDTTPGNECDADIFGSMSLYGMDGSAVGANNWTLASAAYAVRDWLDPSRPDNGLYLDVQFINDFIPDVSIYGMYSDANAIIYTNNPIKWFRLPCVDPIVAPNINITQGDITYPSFWIKNGTAKTLSVEVENVGNAALVVDSITYLSTQGPGGWLSISPTQFASIAPGSSDLFDLTFNPGGFITTPTNLEGEVHVNSNDTTKPQVVIPISTIVADTVVSVSWDSIATSLDVGLAVASNGNAGNRGNRANGGLNLDFSKAGDCDADATIYLYDLSMLLMFDQNNYSWQPFYLPSTARDYNFQPVGSSVSTSKSNTPLAQIYTSGMFVTADSSVGMVKRWYAPVANVSYMLERIDVFSFDGGTYNDVRIGEWIDWDIPTDTSSNNQGGFVPGSYAYQQGLEYGEDAGCLNSDLRFGASGMLGYYTTSEYVADSTVNHSALYGGHVLLDPSLFAPDTDSLVADSVWKYLGLNTFSADNTEADDQQIVLSFGPQTISPTDTLHVWLVHASVYDGDETALDAMMSEASSWYTTNRAELLNPSCCGKYTGGYSGNTDCSADGKLTLNDITKLIDRVFITHTTLCCEENGNVDGSSDGKMTLNDITKLIDAVFITHAATAPCL